MRRCPAVRRTAAFVATCAVFMVSTPTPAAVIATRTGGNLVITGDLTLPNDITIAGTLGGQVQIVPNGGTTLNGGGSPLLFDAATGSIALTFEGDCAVSVLAVPVAGGFVMDCRGHLATLSGSGLQVQSDTKVELHGSNNLLDLE